MKNLLKRIKNWFKKAPKEEVQQQSPLPGSPYISIGYGLNKGQYQLHPNQNALGSNLAMNSHIANMGANQNSAIQNQIAQSLYSSYGVSGQNIYNTTTWFSPLKFYRTNFERALDGLEPDDTL